MSNFKSWKIRVGFQRLILVWVISQTPCACSHRLPYQSGPVPDGQLTVPQTLGLAVCRPTDSFMDYYLKRSDPASLPCLFAMLVDPSMESHYPMIIDIIGHVGGSEHEQRLAQWRNQICKKALGRAQWRAIIASLYAQGQFCRRDVVGARGRMKEMLTEQYWTALDLRLADDGAKFGSVNIYDQLRGTAIISYALAPNVDVNRMSAEFLTSLPDDTRRDAIRPNVLPRRINAYVSGVENREQTVPDGHLYWTTIFEKSFEADVFPKLGGCYH